MGATSWKYIVPYQADINLALSRLRDDVFTRGEYSCGGLDNLSAMLERLDPAVAAVYRERYKSLNAELTTKSDSIEEALEKCAEHGTHSILDIDHVSPTEEPGALFPLSDDLLTEIFGTTKPSREMIEQKDIVLQDNGLYGSWEAVYIVLYEEGLPKEIYIEGASGD